MRFYFLLVLFLLFSVAIAQSKKITSNIEKLNNEQFIINHDQKASFSFKSGAAMKLIRSGRSANAQLIKTLDDPSRNIMAQLILCNIYFKKASFAGPKTVSENGENVSKYYLGEEQGEGMIISEVKRNGTYTIFVNPTDLEKIKNYWSKKVSNQ